MATKKPTEDYLSAINSILLEEEENTLRPGEFTTEMFQKEYEKKFGPASPSQYYRILEAKVKAKTATARKFRLDGRLVKAYTLKK